MAPKTALATDDIGIYLIEFPDRRIYVGSSKRIRIRFMDHRSRLVRGDHSNPLMQRAWSRFGSAIFRTIIVCRESELLLYEQLCMNKLLPTLNLSPIAGRAILSEEGRARIKERMKTFRHTPEACAKISRAKKGISTGPQSDATKAKRSAALMGNKNGLGVRMSEVAKAQLKKRMKGNKYRVGSHQTDAQRAANSKRLQGNKQTRGRVRPEHERRQISDKMKLIWASRRLAQESVR